MDICLVKRMYLLQEAFIPALCEACFNLLYLMSFVLLSESGVLIKRDMLNMPSGGACACTVPWARTTCTAAPPDEWCPAALREASRSCPWRPGRRSPSHAGWGSVFCVRRRGSSARP